MTFRIGCEDGSEATARRALTAAMNGCSQMFRNWYNEWVNLALKKQAIQEATAKPASGRPKIIRRPTLKQ
jgi:murein endopeptidase